MKYPLKILLCLLATAFPILCFAQSNINDSLSKHIGFISVTAYMIVESPEKKLRDSLQWQQQDLIVKKYGGKRIKQILFQKSTGRVVVFFHDRDNVEMNKATAIKEGLLKTDPIIPVKEKTAFVYQPPRDIYIDSPVYIGIRNRVTIYGPDAEDILIAQPGIEILSTGNADEYFITAKTPGTETIVFQDSGTKKTKYLCHVKVKRLPADDLATEPEIRLGNIKTLTTTPDILKQQKEIFVGNGLTLAGGKVYFSGPGFRDVIVTDLDDKLTYMKPFLDICLPGADIVFDNITVKDAGNKIYALSGFSIKVTDVADTAGAIEDYYALTSFPEFIDDRAGLKYYVRTQLLAANEITANQQAAFIFKVEEDGSIAPVSDGLLNSFTSFEKKCFEIIKNGPKWTPGKYNGKAAAMVVTFSAVFE